MPEDKDAEGKNLAELSPEDLVDIIKSLRRENAARRVKDKDLEANIKEYEDWKTSQLSETERLKKERDDAIASARKTLIDTYADKFNVPEERRKFLSGENAEEIMAAAKVLGEVKDDSGVNSDGKNTGSTSTQTTTTLPPANLFPGVSGPPVGSKATATDMDAILRAALRGEK